MSAATALVPSDAAVKAAQVEREVAAAKTQAEAIEVVDQASADLAGVLLREIATKKKRIEEVRKELKEPVLDAGRRIDRQAKDATAAFDAVDAIVRPKLAAYTAEVERVRREEEKRLDRERQERERKAREVRERQEAQERATREQREREQREAEEEARKAKDDADREAAKALADEARRKAEEASVAEQAIASLPDVSLPKAVVPSAPKQEGISTRKVWKATVVHPGQVPVEYLMVDEKKIRQAVRDGVREIPGVLIEQVDEMSVRS